MFKRYYKLVIGTMVVIGMSVSLVVMGQEPMSLSELERAEILEIPGAKVASSNDASRIAERAYFEKIRSLSAYEGPGRADIVEIGFVVKDFAKPGDKVWEIRFTNMSPSGHRVLRAILWVHSETERVHFVCGPWE